MTTNGKEATNVKVRQGGVCMGEFERGKRKGDM